MVLIKHDEARSYLLTRLCAQNDLTALECQLMIGAIKIGKSGFWIGPFVTELLSEYAAGERTSVGQVMAKLAARIAVFERGAAAADPKILKRFTGKWTEKAHEHPTAGSDEGEREIKDLFERGRQVIADGSEVRP